MLIVSHDHVLNLVSSTEPWWTIVNCVQVRSIVANNGQPWSTVGNYVINHFHEHWNLTNLLNVSIQQRPSWMSECDKSLQCHNMTSSLMIVAIWQRHCCLSHCNIYFHECHNATSTLMIVAMWHHLWWCHNVTSALMNVIMRHQLWWMSKCDIHQCQLSYKCRIVAFIKFNFDECCNVTSNLMNVAMQH